MQKPSTPHVAVLVDTSTGWGRRLIRGVLNYSQKHGPWRLWIEPHGRHDEIALPRDWKGDGMICRVSSAAVARKLIRLKIPVVNVSGIQLHRPTVHFPRVTTDPIAAVQLAVEHFLDRGFRRFAYVGLNNVPYVIDHYQAFAKVLSDRGLGCERFEKERSEKGWRAQSAALARWVRKLPRPTAVLTYSLDGLAVLDACRVAGVRVPEEVAVLAGDQDDLLCEAATPPLSGIETPSEAIGYESAAVLDSLLAHRPISSQSILLPPRRIVSRQSSDTLAISDPDLAAAVAYIREHATEPIDVNSVLDHVPTSRRNLERRFEEILGRTPAEEIRRVRLHRAQTLLIDTDLQIPQVAAACGYGSPEYMSVSFKSATGLSPLQYRSRMRAR